MPEPFSHHAIEAHGWRQGAILGPGLTQAACRHSGLAQGVFVVALLEGVRRYDREAAEWYQSVVPLKIRVRRHHAEVPVFPHVLLYGARPWDEAAVKQIDACVETLVPAWIQAFDQHQGPGRGLQVVRRLVDDRELNVQLLQRAAGRGVPVHRRAATGRRRVTTARRPLPV